MNKWMMNMSPAPGVGNEIYIYGALSVEGIYYLRIGLCLIYIHKV